MSYTAKSPIIIEYPDWDVTQNKYMPPKVNDKGGKAITVISKQTNRGLSVSTPLMITWGISDFCDEQGNSDGKFAMSLSFPNDEYKTPESDEFLKKCKDFENQILDDAVANSEVWWGEKMSRELVKHTFFPFLKYSKDKNTKKTDYSKPPGLKAKVPCYNDKWACQIYDPELNLLFPSDKNPQATPMDFVPKASSVVCGLQCTGIWIGGKGWGITWKLIQCIVKPKVVVSVFDKCHLKLSLKDMESIKTQVVKEEEPVEQYQEDDVEPLVEDVKVQETIVEDSDNEQEPEPEVVKEPEPVVVKKKVVKKIEPEVETVPVPAVKKIVKKKVVIA